MKTLTFDQLQKLRNEKKDLPVINVLAPEAFHKEHIPGSINVPREANESTFPARVERVTGSKDRAVVVYCGSEECQASPKAAKALESAGFKEVYDFEGGMRAWKAAGHKVGTGEAIPV